MPTCLQRAQSAKSNPTECEIALGVGLILQYGYVLNLLLSDLKFAPALSKLTG